MPPGTKATLEHFYAVLHPDDRERVRALIRHSHDTNEDYRAEYRILQPDGSHRWIAGMGRTYAGPDGRPASMTGVTLDITPLKQAEQSLVELNATLEKRIEERTRALNAERRRLEATLDSLLDPHLLAELRCAMPTGESSTSASSTRIRRPAPGSAPTAGGSAAARAKCIPHPEHVADPDVRQDGRHRLPHRRRCVPLSARRPWHQSARHPCGQGGWHIGFTLADVTKQYDAAFESVFVEERFRLLAETLRTWSCDDREGRILGVALDHGRARLVGRRVDRRTWSEVLGPTGGGDGFLDDHDGALAGKSVVGAIAAAGERRPEPLGRNPCRPLPDDAWHH